MAYLKINGHLPISCRHLLAYLSVDREMKKSFDFSRFVRQ